MNVLILSGHPAQVHNFRVIKEDLESNGHNIIWMATHKEISKYLLEYYSIDYYSLKKPGKKIFSKIAALFKNTKYCLKQLRNNNIDIIISRVSPYAAIAGFLRKTPHIAIADTESSGIYDKIFSLFPSVILTAKSYQRKLRSDQIRFDGNIELFYLHPNRFKPLSKTVVANMLGIGLEESYIIMRFVSWDAYHDKGLSGFINENKLKAVERFSNYSKIFITSEQSLPIELKKYQIKIPPEKMHDVLAHATLFFGESATMASESAVLGTPAILLDENGRGYTDEEEGFRLVFNFKQSINDQNRAIEKGVELLKMPVLKQKIAPNHESFLKTKIDVTKFFVWFIENYPGSKRIMQENPDYQYRFK